MAVYIESVYFSRMPVSTMYDNYVEYCSEQDMQSNILNINAFTVVMLSFHRVTLKLHNKLNYFQYYAYALYNYLIDINCYTKQKLQYFKDYRQHNAEEVNARRAERCAERKKTRKIKQTDKIAFD